MKIPDLSENLSIISQLGNNPGTDDGLSADELKAKFDEAVLIIQRYINQTLLPKVNASVSPEDGLTMRADIAMGGHRVTDVAAPEEDGDAVNLGYAKKVGNPHNLLDNSDFRNPINQRGATSFLAGASMAAGYVSLDRWIIYGPETTVNLDASGASVDHPGSTTFGFAQRITGLKPGKKYTLACKANVTGEVYLSYGATATANAESATVVPGIDKIHLLTFTAAESSSGVYNVRIRAVQSPATMRLEWMALYEGEYTAENLPEYQTKGYGVELDECQRYYENSWFGTDKSEDPIYTGVIYNASTMDVRIPYKKHKRIVPTITFNPNEDGSLSWRVYNEGSFRAVSNITLSRETTDTVMCRIKKDSADTSTWTPNSAATVCGHWESSADL